MVDGQNLRALLLTGVYGTGKSAVAVEIANILDERDEPYAVLDLDFLMWFRAPGSEAEDYEMMRRNLVAVVSNYRTAGVRTFVLAVSLPDKAELESLRSVLSMPLRVVRLTLPLREIERRLSGDITSGRQDDLRVAAEWLAARTGEGMEDLAVPNDRPLRDVATEIVDWLGWG